MHSFYKLLTNNFIASIVNFTVWFGITFYSYLQTESVLVTGLISGIYLTLTAGCGIWFGSLVDHHKKRTMMLVSSIASLVLFATAFIIYTTASEGAFSLPSSTMLWVLIVATLLGVVAGNIRAITMPVLVSIFVEEDKRDKANGLVGMTFGFSFMIVSVVSGILVGYSGMFHILLGAVILTSLLIIHLLLTPIPEKGIVHISGHSKIDMKGTIKAISAVPGLFALIFFTTFNNFLGGVFMALMDAYGLSMVSVETWGILWGFLSTAFIIGGIVISKWGLGKNPLKSMLTANLVIWSICSVFTIYPSIFPLVIGMFIYLCVAPFIEASEQTVVQKVVPVERQGRVFGFAQSVEQAASPLTAFIIGPLTQFFFIPFMTTGAGVQLIGNWFGTGSSRGIALVFTIAGIIGVTTTLIAFRSRPYKILSQQYSASKDTV